jgi:DNA protecting protein DprA
MESINTIPGLLFRFYLAGYNLSFIHKCIKSNNDDYKTEEYRKASLATSSYRFERNVLRAKELTERYLAYCESNGIHIIAHFEKHYPPGLLAIKDFPPLLFVKGSLRAINYAAIVGTREVSLLAMPKTEYIAKTFARHNYGMISGLAQGVDTLAHEAALKIGAPTIAVLPSSVDNIYPKENTQLASRIVDSGGALISEQAPNYAPLANPFILRNRIIAGLAKYLLPVEMGKDSGTRHAVHYAIKFGKKVILIKPGPDEINHHLSHYDGIILAIKKYRAKPNLEIVKALSELSSHLEKPRTAQPDLFNCSW